MKSILVVSALMLSSCATATLDPGGQKVRFVSTSPMNCEYLGEVSGDFRDSKSFGIVRDSQGFAEVDLKNQAAKLGADTVEVRWNNGRQATGEAYNCGRVPASK